MQMGNICYVCLERFDKLDKGQLKRIADAVRRNVPSFSNANIIINDWQLRIYLRLTLISPIFAVLGKKIGRLIELAAIVRNKLLK
jgi:hypothetical protein